MGGYRSNHVNVGAIAQPYQDLNRGFGQVGDALRTFQDRGYARDERAGVALDKLGVLADANTMRGAGEAVRGQLEEAMTGRVNAQAQQGFAENQMSEAYTTALKANDDQYKLDEAEGLVGYDGSGQPIESKASIEHKARADALNKQYATEIAQHEQNNMRLSEALVGSYDKSLDVNNYKTKYEEHLISQGINPDIARTEAAAATKKYQTPDLSDRQKTQVKTLQDTINNAYKNVDKTSTTVGKGSKKSSTSTKGSTRYSANKGLGDQLFENSGIKSIRDERGFNEVYDAINTDTLDSINGITATLKASGASDAAIYEALMNSTEGTGEKGGNKQFNVANAAQYLKNNPKGTGQYTNGGGNGDYGSTTRTRSGLSPQAAKTVQDAQSQLQGILNSGNRTSIGDVLGVDTSGIRSNTFKEAKVENKKLVDSFTKPPKTKGTSNNRVVSKNPVINALNSKAGDNALKKAFDKSPDEFSSNVAKIKDEKTLKRLGDVLGSYKAGSFGVDNEVKKAIAEKDAGDDTGYKQVQQDAVTAFKAVDSDKSLTQVEKGAKKLALRMKYGAAATGEFFSSALIGLDNAGTTVGNLFRTDADQKDMLSLKDGKQRFADMFKPSTPVEKTIKNPANEAVWDNFISDIQKDIPANAPVGKSPHDGPKKTVQQVLREKNAADVKKAKRYDRYSKKAGELFGDIPDANYKKFSVANALKPKEGPMNPNASTKLNSLVKSSASDREVAQFMKKEMFPDMTLAQLIKAVKERRNN